MRKIAVLIAMIAFPALLLAQEPDPGTKPEHEKDAVNTESVDRAAYTASVNFTAVDKHALNLPSKYKTIQSLATDLFQPFSTQQEKVRAIFMWITNNISYDCVAYHSKKSTRVSFTYSTQQELAEKKEKYYFDYATRVLQSRKAVCEGYAALFNALCKQAGIQSEVVIGTASNNIEKIKRLKDRKNFFSNHTWNKVMIDGTWYYADATWASGYCDVGVKHFFKEFKPYYFITPLDQLYETHAVNVKATEQRNQSN
ncbi:MAG TPA: transglutaminase domain-containing protein [Bacteroidia bacterium]|jgi:transglutaminase/protease-like cytokinesis protein 3|nr:transglutaminase domain-containing protein [Bacteroidia bacterium]HRG52962.1 transglutaminase domain-containing protein [Bacteroidia bacterium]